MSRKRDHKIKYNKDGKLCIEPVKKRKVKSEKKSQDELDALIQQIEDNSEIRKQIKHVKLESLVGIRPETIFNFLIDQFKGAETFEVHRVDYFSRDNKSTFGNLGALRSLKHLKLREIKLNDEQFDFMVEKLQSTNLQTLDVSFNNLTDPKSFKSLFQDYQLTILNLNRNQLGAAQVNEILSLVQYCSSLKILDLSSNGYAYTHCRGCIEDELFKLLKRNFTLEELYLLDAAFEFKDVDKLYKSMLEIFDPRYSSELRELHLSYYCQQQSKQNSCEEKFKIFERFGNEANRLA